MSQVQKSDPFHVTSWDREKLRWGFLRLQTSDFGKQMAPTIIVGLISLAAAWHYGALGAISGQGLFVLAGIAIGSPLVARLWVMLMGRKTVDADMATAKREKEDHDEAITFAKTHGD
jgi:hypothetical protein